MLDIPIMRPGLCKEMIKQQTVKEMEELITNSINSAINKKQKYCVVGEHPTYEICQELRAKGYHLVFRLPRPYVAPVETVIEFEKGASSENIEYKKLSLMEKMIEVLT